MRYLVLSDMHFEHKAIIESCNRPTNYESIIVSNWASMAQEEDISLCLGDITFGKKEGLKTILERIKGKKYLVRGNHDHLSTSQYLWAGFDGVFNELVINHILYTHEPVFFYGGRVDLNVHGHLHNIGYKHKAAFGGTYEALNDGKHILYSPEEQDYMPINSQDLLVRRNT